MARSKFPKFSAVQARADFPAILKHYGIEARLEGDELVCNCPFHEDRTPACFINPAKRVFKCFGCGAGGNVFEFVRLKEGLEDSGPELGQVVEIIMDVSRIAKADVMDGDVSISKVMDRADPPAEIAKKEETEVPVNTPLSFSLQLDDGGPYLKSKGVCDEAARIFGIGIAKRGTMRGRIVIPIHNAKGELVAYSGRFAGKSLPEGEPRYKLPKKFNKSLELFNLHRATTLGFAFVVIVEGFWSAIRLHMLGIPAVAVMGSHARSTQLDLIIEAGFTHAYIIMDGDEAGRLGAEKAVNDLAGRIFVRRIDLPEGVKPDTMGQEWIDQLK